MLTHDRTIAQQITRLEASDQLLKLHLELHEIDALKDEDREQIAAAYLLARGQKTSEVQEILRGILEREHRAFQEILNPFVDVSAQEQEILSYIDQLQRVFEKLFWEELPPEWGGPDIDDSHFY